MKKFIYLFAFIAIALCFVQCETSKIGQNGMHKDHEYVDLGLSVKWATCNVGATTSEAFGDYFAWGEVAPKEIYSFETYKYCQGTEKSLTKYCCDKDYGLNGFVDNKLELDPEDDAASVNWGGKWRMPTADEFDELRYSCTWEWTTQNGVKGLLGTSRVEGYTDRTIFFPATGFILEDINSADMNLDFLQDCGYYLSKSQMKSENYPLYISALYFVEGKIEPDFIFLRYGGATVRAVCP
jgi:hypothetical protein